MDWVGQGMGTPVLQPEEGQMPARVCRLGFVLLRPRPAPTLLGPCSVLGVDAKDRALAMTFVEAWYRNHSQFDRPMLYEALSGQNERERQVLEGGQTIERGPGCSDARV